MQRWEFPRQVRGHVQVPKVLMCLRGYWVMVNGKWYKLYGGFWFYFVTLQEFYVLFRGSCLVHSLV